MSDEEEDEDINRVAKVWKVKDVQKAKIEKFSSKVQAILINPKWKVSKDYVPVD